MLNTGNTEEFMIIVEINGFLMKKLGKKYTETDFVIQIKEKVNNVVNCIDKLEDPINEGWCGNGGLRYQLLDSLKKGGIVVRDLTLTVFFRRVPNMILLKT